MDHSMTILIMDLHLVDQEAVEVGEVVAVVVSVMDLLEDSSMDRMDPQVDVAVDPHLAMIERDLTSLLGEIEVVEVAASEEVEDLEVVEEASMISEMIEVTVEIVVVEDLVEAIVVEEDSVIVVLVAIVDLTAIEIGIGTAIVTVTAENAVDHAIWIVTIVMIAMTATTATVTAIMIATIETAIAITIEEKIMIARLVIEETVSVKDEVDGENGDPKSRLKMITKIQNNNPMWVMVPPRMLLVP